MRISVGGISKYEVSGFRCRVSGVGCRVSEGRIQKTDDRKQRSEDRGHKKRDSYLLLVIGWCVDSDVRRWRAGDGEQRSKAIC
jgi:hypothetical protein